MNAWSKVADALGWLVITIAVLATAWLCTRTSESLRPEEVDCIAELRAATRKDTSYSQQDVVTYGRCLCESRR